MKLDLRGGAAAAMAIALLLPASAHAQLRVITSGGFAEAYRRMLPELKRAAGMDVTTGSGASQGSGPDTIGAQLRRGVPADVVILSREGLADLIAEGRIVPGSDVDLAQAPLGAAVRAGAPKPDIGTVAAFKQTLLDAKTIAVPGSTSGIYLTTILFPRLGVADRISVTVATRGGQSTALVASGKANLAIQPTSELVSVDGLEFVGPIPSELQLVQVFSAAIVKGSDKQAAAGRLIAVLASDKAAEAIRLSGMDSVEKARSRPER